MEKGFLFKTVVEGKSSMHVHPSHGEDQSSRMLDPYDEL